MKLTDWTDEELQAELERRDVAEKPIAPLMIDKPDFTKLRKACAGHMEFVQSDDYCEDNDHRSYIYEAAMTAYYSELFWTYLRLRE
ncbi:MAG: hypothetical protein V3W37_02980 [Candidatus Binatia bacterium]